MKPSSIMIGILILGAMSLGIFSFYTDFAITYGVSYTNVTFLSSSYTNEIMSIGNDTANTLTNIASTKPDFINGVSTAALLFLKVLVYLVKLPILLQGVVSYLMHVSGIYGVIPIPSWFITMIMGIIVIFIVFRIISTFVGGRDL